MKKRYEQIDPNDYQLIKDADKNPKLTSRDDKILRLEGGQVAPRNVTFYGSRFSSIAFPARTPKARFWSRSNGRDTLLIEAGMKECQKTGQLKELKVPSGIIPRRLLLYLSHKWMENREKKKRDRKIELGSSMFDFVEKLNMVKGGKQYKSILDQCDRLFLSKIAFHSSSKMFYSVKQALVARDYEIWWSKIEDQYSLIPSWVEVTEDFACFLDKSIPLSVETIQALGGNCLAFDIYTWLNYRHYSIANPFLIKWDELHSQLGCGYGGENQRKFKQKFEKAWKMVKSYYGHNSKLDPNGEGVWLIRSKPDIETKNYSSAKSKEFLKILGCDL